MEPDLHLLPRSPAGLQGAHAGDHGLGPAPGPGGGERVPGRGGFHQNLSETVDLRGSHHDASISRRLFSLQQNNVLYI